MPELGAVLETAGLPTADVEAWCAGEPAPATAFEPASAATCAYLTHGEQLLARLPSRRDRNGAEAEAAALLQSELDAARARFLRVHAESVYEALTDGLRRPRARRERSSTPLPTASPGSCRRGRRWRPSGPGPCPRRTASRSRRDLFLSFVLASPRCGAHLVWSMLRPTDAALARLEEFQATGIADLGGTYLERRGRAAYLEIRNDRHLNAEDCDTLPTTEVAVDLALLDPAVEVGVIRGAVVSHPRYAGRRVFGAGLNLTHLYHGRIDYLFFVTRDLGYVNKLFRGLSHEEHRPAEPEETTEKLWLAAVETFAIGGACQILHTVDHVIATRGARLYLPARKEGILPGASNLRLARSVGDRLARQAILSGLEFEAGTPHGDLLCDEIVESLRRVGRGCRPARRGADELRARERGRQPAGTARRGGAARRLPAVHGHLLPRAGLLPSEPRARPQPRRALERPRAPRLSP